MKRKWSTYIKCPNCGEVLRVIKKLEKYGHKKKVDWSRVDWSRGTTELSRRYKVDLTHLSHMRRKYDPQTLANRPKCKPEKDTYMRKYKGFLIIRWTGPYGLTPDKGEPRYYVQTHHETGNDWAPEHCPRAWSLREAREKIDEIIGRSVV